MPLPIGLHKPKAASYPGITVMSIDDIFDESDMDSVIESIHDLSIGDADLDQSEMLQVFQHVNRSNRDQFLRSEDYFDGVERLLRSKSYIPSFYRNFLCAISDSLELEGSPLRLIEMKSKPREVYQS